MDAQALNQILTNFQKSNQEFLEKILNENKVLMEGVLKKDVHVSGISTFRPYNRQVDKWATYMLQLEQHFVANNVTDETTKRACFLSWIGSELLELLQKIVPGGDPKNKTFKELTTILSEHLVSKQHILAARYKFYKTFMKPDQSYTDWVAELKGAARDCGFQCKKAGCEESYVDFKIRDMVVMNTPHDKVRIAALQKTNPTLEEVLEIAVLYEDTEKTFNALKGESNSAVVNAVNSPSTSKGHQYRGRSRTRYRNQDRAKSKMNASRKSCPDCGSAHTREDCYHFKNKSICDTCGKVGHISKVCQSKSSPIPKSNSRFKSSSKVNPASKEKVNSVEESFHQIGMIDIKD